MQYKQREIKFFNRFDRKGYDALTERGYDRILREFKKLVKPVPREILADFGCGTGAFTHRFERLGLNCIGIDISPKCIEYAKKAYSKTKFVVGDIEKTKLKSNSVDIVVFSGVLHHFENFRPTVREAYRILKKGGRAFSFDPNKRNPIMWLYRDKKSLIHSTKGKTENERLLTVEEIYQILNKAGFKKLKTHAISGVGFKYVESDIATPILPAYNFIELVLDNTPFAKSHGSFLIAKGEK